MGGMRYDMGGMLIGGTERTLDYTLDRCGRSTHVYTCETSNQGSLRLSGDSANVQEYYSDLFATLYHRDKVHKTRLCDPSADHFKFLPQPLSRSAFSAFIRSPKSCDRMKMTVGAATMA